MKTAWMIAAVAAAFCGLAHPAAAGTNLVLNGGFDAPALTASVQLNNSNMPNWTNGTDGSGNNGYNFIFLPGTADTTGAYTPQFQGQIQLWGSHNGGTTVLPANDPYGTGGDFIAADGAFEQGTISQTVTGLVVGTNYALTFDWAAGQQQGFTGATTEAWSVSFGSQVYNTAVVTTPSQGFTAWRQDGAVFRATSTSMVLSFLAGGTPNGQPPFSLLDNVAVVAAPEPNAASLVLVAAALLAVCRLHGRNRQARRHSLPAPPLFT